ncbi:MAG: D-alanyl-D-alanine carboxypeptidase family protein [Lactimicrobium sp.]|jgi:D-alanyl-D-alanine carboxypeptidase|uniref:D-alanyl-D-alanine carboxypeptidase family protein n=1 Tax=Lactimicrobium sp. TaxID=2563780 RepID=UPI002F35BE8F
MKITKLILAAVLTANTMNIPVHAESQETNSSASTLSLDVNLESDDAYVIDPENGQILLDQNSDEKIYPASMTKIMTAVVVLESGISLDQTVTITDEMLNGLYEAEAAVVGYSTGDTPTVRDLLYGALLPSGADAVNALAYTVSGSIDAFVQAMNQKAKELGMGNTHFVNPTGLHDDNHYSTCKDIATLTAYAVQNETFRQIFSSSSYTDTLGNLMYSTVAGAIERDNISLPGFVGDKTGYTDDAGHCMASYAELNGMKIITVTAHAMTDIYDTAHLKDASTILNALNSWSRKTVLSSGDTLGSYMAEKVIGRTEETVTSSQNITADVPNEAKIAVTTDLAESYKVTNKDQTKQLNVTITADGKTAAETSQTFTVPKASDFFNRVLIFFRDLF